MPPQEPGHTPKPAPIILEAHGSRKPALVFLVFLGIFSVGGFVAGCLMAFIGLAFSFDAPHQTALELLSKFLFLFPLTYILPFALAYFFYNKSEFTLTTVTSAVAVIFLLIEAFCMFFLQGTESLLLIMGWGVTTSLPPYILWYFLKSKPDIFKKAFFAYVGAVILILAWSLYSSYQQYVSFKQLEASLQNNLQNIPGSSRSALSDPVLNDKRRMSDMINMQIYLELFKNTKNEYPSTLDELIPTYIPSNESDLLTNLEYTVATDTSTYTLCTGLQASTTATKYCVKNF